MHILLDHCGDSMCNSYWSSSPLGFTSQHHPIELFCSLFFLLPIFDGRLVGFNISHTSWWKMIHAAILGIEAWQPQLDVVTDAVEEILLPNTGSRQSANGSLRIPHERPNVWNSKTLTAFRGQVIWLGPRGSRAGSNCRIKMTSQCRAELDHIWNRSLIRECLKICEAMPASD